MRAPSRHHGPRRAAVCVTLAAALAGCSQAHPADPPAPASGGRRHSAPADPVRTCTELVTYWALEALKGSRWAGLDWEQKGLSNEQLALHDEVLAAARAKRRLEGSEAAKDLIRHQVAEKCAAQGGATGSSRNWRPVPHGTASSTQK
ncbi:hypothetical protein [Streptomyces palmae]|uniref:Lipoprotein n=1 Tax=Streptomyces palmae TaxID=1701085 RepID=A0A4Z0H838_9ACTN|nr:hypothetical protein [Streptomyces palmae]TGB08568.1 hypothetical protein E4099_15170 [Streptomyces palmae]